jgi:hypothetical protein
MYSRRITSGSVVIAARMDAGIAHMVFADLSLPTVPPEMDRNPWKDKHIPG